MLFVPTFSDFGVGNHVSSGLVDSFPQASHFAGCNFALQRFGHGPGLTVKTVADFSFCLSVCLSFRFCSLYFFLFSFFLNV